ncbi:MAG: DNA helicase [Chloroflexi bacterium RBG_16_51_9]|nr:MAG: DNA helicase [Chloroflexi bacterium RBG_16_51_9]
MKTLNLKASHKSIKDYYEALSSLSELGVSHEGAVSPAFATLLQSCARQFDRSLVEQYPMKVKTHTIFIDGALVNAFNMPHGFWEAKDTSDDLDKEIKKKFAAGSPKNNILFQAPNRIVIYQDSLEVFDKEISTPELLIEGLRLFFEYEEPAFEQFEQAVEEFKFKVRDLAGGLLQLIEKERQTNTVFIGAFDDFVQLCQETINPNISIQAVEEMLIQHLLTERIFRKVFNNPDFVERNVIAHEIEKVISALTSQSFSRNEFLKSLDRFYVAIETAAATIDDFSQKQSFLNTVYEKFFQGFSVKVADTHGIVYTPQPIVKFMVKSVEHILQKEFGRSLSDKDVHIIDPFVGTGNFILWVMREIQHSKLPYKYANELHCNEVMLLPYYIASMNIEHEYYEVTGNYHPFEGICLVDTFDLAKVKQLSLFTKENTARVKRQQAAPIFVVLGNPPYNAGQVNENDNNKNRKYEEIDKRVSQTYAKGSKATLLRKLNDPFVKAIRWASDRIGDEGIVAFVTNNSFVNEITFDGMRKCLEQDFDSIHILDLGGNVRKNPKLSGSTHNVFGIQVGVSINLLVKTKSKSPKKAKIHYARVDEFWHKAQKYDFLNKKADIANIDWNELAPDKTNAWLTEGLQADFETLIPMSTRDNNNESCMVFKVFSPGVNTARDAVVYDFDSKTLANRAQQFCDDYNTETMRYQAKGKPNDIDSFVNYDKVRWSSTLKLHLKRGTIAKFDSEKIRTSLYRPFTVQYLYYDAVLNERPGLFRKILPGKKDESENRVMCINRTGEKPFCCLLSNRIPNFVTCGGFGAATEAFPFYTYDEDGSNRQENITDWALAQFQEQYKDKKISKVDIFNYIYAILHHPQYREKYAANLKRELPRIPFAPDFWAFAKAGKRLAEIHVNYEKQAEYPLTWLEDKTTKVDYRVERMTLSKDKTQIIYNDFLTLGGIPPEVFEYRLGNRSALDWIIDQYQVSTDKRSGITNDPNNLDDPQYIIRLIGKVITVSLETMKIIKTLPGMA